MDFILFNSPDLLDFRFFAFENQKIALFRSEVRPPPDIYYYNANRSTDLSLKSIIQIAVFFILK